MSDIDLNALSIPGRELCSLSQEEFFQRVPRGEILWSHLELLRKCMGDFSVTGFTFPHFSLFLSFKWKPTVSSFFSLLNIGSKNEGINSK